MGSFFGKASMGSRLDATKIPAPKIAKAREFTTPFGRIALTRDRGNGKILGYGDAPLMSNLTAIHRRADGTLIDVYDLGSGSTTNPGVNCLVNDVLGWALSPALAKFNYHGCGTGTTASAISDYWLQTAIGSGNLTGSTNGYFTGVQSIVAPNIYKSVATSVFTGSSQAVTEWVLTMSNAAPFTGRSATSTTANSLTDTGASFTTTGNGLMGWSVEANSTAVNTPTTTAFGTITTNSATVLTLGVGAAGGWWTLANASASTPSGTTNYVVYPTTLDHKVFSQINVNSGDSIQWVYQLTLTPQI